MTNLSHAPIPVTILTGFLGAGKTTLLNRILNADHGLRVAVLVNDFGTVNIDSQIVVNVDADDTIELSNGCICCTIRGDLLGALIRLIERPNPPDYIVIEASGVSDPLEIALTFKQDALKSQITIDAVLTVVDAEQILNLDRENEVLAVLQIGAADIVMLNKVDLVDDEELGRVRTWIRSIINNARIIEVTYGKVPMPLILGIEAFSPDKLGNHTVTDIHVHTPDETHHHHDHDMIFDTWSWYSDKPLSLRTLQRAIEQLPADIYRIKGFVYLDNAPDEQMLLQVVGKRATIVKSPKETTYSRKSEIVLIGSHGKLDLAVLQETFNRTISSSSDDSGLSKMINAMISWIRHG